MDPVTTSLFLAASLGVSLRMNGMQRKVDDAYAKLDSEQLRLQTAEMALERTKQARSQLSLNNAMAGMGIGADNALAQTANLSVGALNQDLQLLDKQQKLNSLFTNQKLTNNKLKQFTSNLNALTQSISMANDLNLFDKQTFLGRKNGTNPR